MRRLVIASLVAVTAALMVAACSSGEGETTSEAAPTTQRPTSIVLRPTTTAPLSPLAAVMARPHTMAECIGVGASTDDFTACMRDATDAPETVREGFRLEVEGSGSASLTYSMGGGNTAQQDVTLPWSLEVADPYPDGQYLSAQLQGSGTITCRILSQTDYKLAEVTSSGEYVIATCNHDAPIFDN